METKEALRKIEKVAKSNMGTIKKTIPSIFLIGDIGAGSSEFSHKYEEILRTNYVYSVRGTGTYLELVFPVNGSEKDYQRFFRSPLIVASIQNRFYGVFVISFEEWKGRNLLASKELEMLLKFVGNNRDNIFFVFQVTRDFEAKAELKSILGNHINVMEAELDMISIKTAVKYVKDCLSSHGIEFEESAFRELSDFLKRELDLESSAFAGYQSLNELSKCIAFELSAQYMPEDITMIVTDEMIRSIKNKIILPKENSDICKTIGFSM